MTPFTRVSASQITLFRRCPRKWFTEHILGRRSPSTANQELGTRIHAEIERYLLGGPLPTYESARRLANDAAFPPKGGLVEWPQDYGLGLKIDDIAVRGRIDYVTPVLEHVVHIYDWKSTSAFTWCKTSAELEHDVQCILYSKALLEKFPEAIGTTFCHGYVLTRGTGHRFVPTVLLSRDTINTRYAGIVETVREMARIARLPLEQVPQNLNACGDYGGCAFRIECGVFKNQTFDAMFGADTKQSASNPEPSMSLAEKLKNRPKSPPVAEAASAEPIQSILPPDAPKPAPVTPYVQPEAKAEEKALPPENLPFGLGGTAQALLLSKGGLTYTSIEFGPETLKRIDRYLDLYSSGR